LLILPTNQGTIYSNCDQVVLYLNDSLIDRRTPTINQFSDYLDYPPFHFNLDHFEPGTLRAVGLIDDQKAAVDSVHTSAEPFGIQLQIDSSGGKDDELNDLYFVYATIVDSSGNMVHSAENEILFELQGNGELIGANPVKAEAGVAAILMKKGKRGSEFRITAYSDGLQSGVINGD